MFTLTKSEEVNIAITPFYYCQKILHSFGGRIFHLIVRESSSQLIQIMTEQKPKYKYDVRLKLTKKPQNILNSKGFFIEMIKIRLGNFLGFEFLVKNEELIHYSHKDEGIFEE